LYNEREIKPVVEQTKFDHGSIRRAPYTHTCTVLYIDNRVASALRQYYIAMDPYGFDGIDLNWDKSEHFKQNSTFFWECMLGLG
jgi:hypothetical protein